MKQRAKGEGADASRRSAPTSARGAGVVVIKRYANRKLYDTAARRYIALGGIADLIRAGAEVQVLDHASGEDITGLVLAQIIAGQERRQGGGLPLPLLTDLVQVGGETLASLRRALNAQLDLLRQVDGEIERRLEHLIRRGELAEEEGLRLRDRLLALGQEAVDAFWPPEPILETIRERYGLPTRADLQALSEQIDALTSEVETLCQARGADRSLPPHDDA